MFCWKCGEPIDDGEELCGVCSAKQGNHATTGADTAAKSVAGKVGEQIGAIGGTLGKEIMNSALKEMEKTMLKTAKKGTHKAMVKLKLAKETPLDKAEKIWKKIKK